MEKEQGQILIIDNDETRQKTLIHRLEEEQQQVYAAKDAEEALAILASHNDKAKQVQKLDLIIVEVDMSDHDACQIVKSIQDETKLGYIPIVVTSASGNIDTIQQCLEAGAENYLLATDNPLLLRARIRGWIERKRGVDQASAYAAFSKLEHDIEVGHQIQADFLLDEESIPQPEGWEVASYFYPARQVAGDFFDVIPLARGKLGLVIADVCDKGVGPALFMALARTLIRAFAEQPRPLSWMDVDKLLDTRAKTDSKKSAKRQMLMSSGISALQAVELTNEYIVTNHLDMNMFATLFFGVLDPATGLLIYVNGGHDAPAVVGTDGEVKIRLKPTGPAVGIFPNTHYKIDQVTLESGDLLMMFTDGAFDARSPEGERFGIDRLLALLKQSDPSVVDLRDRIVRNLRQHIGSADQFDDITMLAVRHKLTK